MTSTSDDRTLVIWDLENILKIDKLTYACDLMKDYLQNSQQANEGDFSVLPTLCDR